MYKRGKYENCKTPQLILLDLNLPVKNGLEVLRKIKTDNKLRLIPVIILTTSKNKDDVCEAYKNYASAYIAKPTDFSDFKAF